ncbi:MAG: flagellin [Ignavibacteriae bacterium]|nr:flagellin [Ignavibacteriota bacterium]
MAQSISLTGAMRANLLSLQNTVSLMNRTQDRLSTGKKVNSALDSPTNYFAAKAHLNRANDITARKDSMNEAIQTVKTASSGIESINTLIESAKGIAQAALATSDTTQRAQYVTQYNSVISQINTMASDSGYRGTNLLVSNTMTVKFNEDGASSLSIEGFKATATGLTVGIVGQATGGITASWSDSTSGTLSINSALTQLSSALDTLRVKASALSSSLSVVQTRADWADTMVATLNGGANALTEADMNEEGANMLMLQTRQSLGTTALSLSAQNAQSVLRLF